MKTLHKLKLTILFARFLNKILSNRIKRLVFLSSLTAVLVDATELDNETLHKLNTLLGLCINDNAMRLPISMRDFIWHHMTLAQVLSTEPTWTDLTEEKISSMTSSIMRKMPSWLHYSKEVDIKRDVECLLHNSNSISFS